MEPILVKEKVDTTNLFANIFGNYFYEIVMIFNAKGEIVFNNSNLNVLNINEIKNVIKFNDNESLKILQNFIDNRPKEVIDFITSVFINDKEEYARIVLNFIEINNIKYYLIVINNKINKLNDDCETKFKAVFEKSPVGIASVDAKSGKIINANPEFCKLIGYELEELQTKTVKDITYEEDFTKELNLLNRLQQSNNKLEFIKRYIKKNGEIITANLTTTYVKDFLGNEIVIGIIIDITDKLKLANAEKEKTELINKISLTTPDTILILDLKNQVVTFHNHANFYNQSNFSFLNLSIKDLKKFIYVEDIENFEKHINFILQSDVDIIHECTIRIVLNMENISWVLCRGTVFKRDVNKKPIQILLQLTDITSQKILEDTLRKTNEQINEKNVILEEQRKQLIRTKEDLENASKKLVEANLNKDKMFSIIAHDLKNPFNSLFGSASFLKQNFENCTNSDIQILTENIYNSAKVIYGLLENLLDWSRLQTNQVYIKKDKINIFEIISNIVQLYKEILKKKEINIDLLIEHNIEIIADKHSLETVIRNLTSNAIKFSYTGSKIIIGLEKHEKDVIIYVKDFGVGMSKEKVDKLFLVEESKSTLGTQNETGTGLGLMICKEMVERNGGKIWVESEIKKGTTFYILLPI